VWSHVWFSVKPVLSAWPSPTFKIDVTSKRFHIVYDHLNILGDKLRPWRNNTTKASSHAVQNVQWTDRTMSSLRYNERSGQLWSRLELSPILLHIWDGKSLFAEYFARFSSTTPSDFIYAFNDDIRKWTMLTVSKSRCTFDSICRS
jgi:hypothetical protein